MKKTLITLFTLIFSIVTVACSITPKSNLQPKDSNIVKNVEASSIYLTFEQLLDAATDIIKGKCVDMVEYVSYTEYKFSVLERYIGEDTGSTISIRVPKKEYSVSDNISVHNSAATDITYNKNNSYFLVLLRFVSVYLEHDVYINVGADLYLPANDLSKCSIYGESLSKHSTLNTENITTFENSLCDSFNSRKNNNSPKFIGTDYIKTNDLKTIIKSSDYILKIRVLNEVHVGVAEDRNTFECSVISSLKGDVGEKTTVCITFPKDSVTKDDECIVALYEITDVTPRSFVFSSKNSLFETSKISDIMQYRNEI